MDFIYDNNGAPYAMKYDGTEYYYVLNLQGDVIRIIDTTGAAVAEYIYDAWGRPVSATGTMAEVNPIRYRGYYFDSDSGLYYLQSRYYDPEIKRFINADSANLITANPYGLTDKNLFSYCDNDPTSRSDYAGNIWQFVAASAVIGGIVGGVTQVATNILTHRALGEGVVGAVVGGAAYGAVAMATNNLKAASAAGAAAEATTNEIASYLTQKKAVTKRNLVNSVSNIICNTAANTALTAASGKLAAKIVKINWGWFQPTKFPACFFGKYARKVWGQTLVQGALIGAAKTFIRWSGGNA